MKIRNKKTGKVQTCDFMVISDDISRDGEIARLNSHTFLFRSIEQLNEEYEDYKPTEPLIKDEKIRKAVKAWASENIIEKAKFEYIAGTGSIFKDGIGDVEIGFYSDLRLTNRETYTITELCGEEE